MRLYISGRKGKEVHEEIEYFEMDKLMAATRSSPRNAMQNYQK